MALRARVGNSHEHQHHFYGRFRRVGPFSFVSLWFYVERDGCGACFVFVCLRSSVVFVLYGYIYVMGVLSSYLVFVCLFVPIINL